MIMWHHINEESGAKIESLNVEICFSIIKPSLRMT
jgi:hypothetical protein